MNRNSILALSAFFALSLFATFQPAMAKGKSPQVSKDAVLAACRHTSGCSYGTDSNTGETGGCSPNACYYCKPGASTCGQVPGHAIQVGDKPKHIIVGNGGFKITNAGFDLNKTTQNLNGANVTATPTVKSLNITATQVQKSLN